MPEMDSVTSNQLKRICRNSFYDVRIRSYELGMISQMAAGGHLGF